MNTRKQVIQKYAAFSLALLMALAGWKSLKARAADVNEVEPNPVEAEIVDNSQPEIDLEPAVEDPIIPEPVPSDPGPVPSQTDEDAIRALLAEHFEMGEREFSYFEVEENTGTHARGSFDNGYFLAAEVEGQWVFAAGGSTPPNCSDLARYGFPASMVPECPSGGSAVPVCQGEGSNQAAFIKDVTIEDGSILEPGQSFTKTWRIQNMGSCTWNSAYQLAFVSGDMLGGALSWPLTDTQVPPGAIVDVSVQLRAPDEPGSYRGYWRFRDSSGESFGLTSGGSIWVDIIVEAGSSGEESSSEVYTGYPFIEILKVSKDQTVTIKGKNFPPRDQFNVVMNYYGTKGVNGTYVTSVQTGDGGEFTDTYQIPAFLVGQSTIAIRLESPYSGYYAYNWFGNY